MLQIHIQKVNEKTSKLTVVCLPDLPDLPQKCNDLFLTYESTLVRILLMLVLIALEMARRDAVLKQKMTMKSMFSVDLLLETL